MARNAKTKMVRKCLVLAFLTVGMLIVIGGKGVKARATSCDDAFTAYTNADNAYYDAYNSYYFDDPTTCVHDCSTRAPAEQPACIDNCEINRYTAAGNAEINMFETSNETCDPVQIDACAEARALAAGCLSQFDVSSTSDPVEQDRIANEYPACRTASKVDSCQ